MLQSLFKFGCSCS